MREFFAKSKKYNFVGYVKRRKSWPNTEPKEEGYLRGGGKMKSVKETGARDRGLATFKLY